MANIRWGSVDCKILAGMFIGKVVTFAVAALYVVMRQRWQPRQPNGQYASGLLGTMGIFCIFATKSNDIALGVPLMDAVYGKVQPMWRVVTTTATGLASEKAQALAQAQLLEAAAALSGCRHIVVHAMSNNGWYAWLRLSRLDPTIGERCAPCAVVRARTCAF